MTDKGSFTLNVKATSLPDEIQFAVHIKLDNYLNTFSLLHSL